MQSNHFMQDYSPVFIVVGVIVLAFIANRFKFFSGWVARNKDLIDFLGIVSVVGLVVAISLTISHFRANERSQRQRETQQLISRLSTVEGELVVNSHICVNELLKSQESHAGKEAQPVPESRFHTDILEQTLASGDIVQEKLRDDLWNLYRLMSTANSLLMQAVLIRHAEHIADPRDLMLINGRRMKVNSLVAGAMEFAKKAKPLLTNALNEIRELKETDSGFYPEDKQMRILSNLKETLTKSPSGWVLLLSTWAAILSLLFAVGTYWLHRAEERKALGVLKNQLNIEYRTLYDALSKDIIQYGQVRESEYSKPFLRKIYRNYIAKQILQTGKFVGMFKKQEALSCFLLIIQGIENINNVDEEGLQRSSRKTVDHFFNNRLVMLREGLIELSEYVDFVYLANVPRHLLGTEEAQKNAKIYETRRERENLVLEIIDKYSSIENFRKLPVQKLPEPPEAD